MEELIAQVEEEDARNQEVSQVVDGLVDQVEKNDRLEKIGNRIREEQRLIYEATEADAKIAAGRFTFTRWKYMLRRAQSRARIMKLYCGLNDF